MNKTIKLTASAHYVPAKIVKNQKLSQIMDTNDQWIQQHTGIQTRHYATKQNTSDLGAKVAQQLLHASGLTAAEVDLIVVATITPDALTPATAVLVQQKIGAVNALAFDVSAACSGFIFALSTAEKFLRSGQYQHAIVIASEVNSKMLDFQDRTSAVFFGDGAGGVLLSTTADPTLELFRGEKLLTKPAPEMIHSGRIPVIQKIAADQYPTLDAFYQDGRAVYNFVTTNVPRYLKKFLLEQHVKNQQIGLVVPHQANLRLIEQLSQQLDIPLSRFAINVAEYGNTSSAGVAIGLDQALKAGKHPEYALLTGFGAGLTFGGMLLNLSQVK
ncbi:3-oxoacyl-(acyl carrier protein) synthase III [Liquorilactobacillus ghanensis DSM 18630]|uniref:3-oxoacyl-(Acyl carrier protein) synthase III n=1 Tax=Liquorilactobacillus ghanensis DSM 18630 TaxID=1423750 RepID=A0A0R1VMQ5_9LACO|nr:beta-ketoacyl-ACP synthase III [Liquorilactobacillus ghanensis]KRM06629.1 3-oxoacyl-(acyl carrier protein) synthase III [Liquorilactobacillus ghanensis DSM 18630]